MNSYEATFGDTHFRIEIESRSSGSGPLFIAVPSALDEKTHVLSSILDDNGGRLEFHDDSEAGALNAASTFLVGRYGHQSGPFTAVPPSTPGR